MVIDRDYWEKFDRKVRERESKKTSNKQCPDCNGDCQVIAPYKQCKQCKQIFKDNEKVE